MYPVGMCWTPVRKSLWMRLLNNLNEGSLCISLTDSEKNPFSVTSQHWAEINLKRGGQLVNEWNLESREEANRKQEKHHWPFSTEFAWVWTFKLVCMCPLCHTSLELYPFSDVTKHCHSTLTSEKLKHTFKLFHAMVLMVTACFSMGNCWANAGRADPAGSKAHPIIAFSRPKITR